MEAARETAERAADALVGGNSFTDVAGNRWSAGFIAYCAQAGIVNGVGNGSVNQALTREKAAQMTLNAIEAPMVTYETKGSSISVNGAEINYGVNLDIVKGERTKIGANGTELNIYYDADKDTLTVIMINTYVAKVASAFKATSTKDA